MDLREQLQATLSGTYTLERELGGGGMSRVFVAEELRLKRQVVVKVLSPELAQGISVDRFEREIQTVAALQQANIVPVLTAGDTNGLPFYTMPFVDGESLRVRLERGPLAVTEIVGILRDVSKALAYAHQRGVVHRDIKPDNVLISGGTAVVTDFGIAKAISASRAASGSATLTQVGTSIGTPAYMAPEQAAGDPMVDERADLYALGAMAYELFTGRVVFADRTPQRMLAAHMSEAPAAMTTLRADIPAPLASLIMSCLAKDPNDRPKKASDIARTLETITSGDGMMAMPPVLLGGPGMFRKAILIYVVAVAVVALVAKAAIVGIGLPDWVFPGALALMALGLPAVLWTGYVQRVTRRAMTTTPTYTPGGTPSLTRGTIATMALKAAPRVSWYRTARVGLYTFGVFVVVIVVFMLLRALGIGPAGSLLASGALNRAEPILLTDFRTSNVDSTLGRVVSDAVRAGLTGSSAFTLVPPTTIAAALQRMKQPPDAPMDSARAREIAVREGIKAFVDGNVTGVPGGYIVSIRLVRADSGIELASFRETGDGPRGLIDAADRLARALRGKAGESLRAVNATPPLSRATTSSLDALRKYSEAQRANQVGDRRAIDLARQAVAIDSTFALAWVRLGIGLNNYGGTRSASDSAFAQAFRFRERLPEGERDLVVSMYYGNGPGRDRAKAIVAYEAQIARGDSSPVVSLGEQLRSQREFARAESLNVAAARHSAHSGIALGNVVDMQLNQGKLAAVDSTLARIRREVPDYHFMDLRRGWLMFARGEYERLRAATDSMRKSQDRESRTAAERLGIAIDFLGGRVRDGGDALQAVLTREGLPPTYSLALQIIVKGPSASLAARFDSAVASIKLAAIPMADRPYFLNATTYARLGNPAKARALMARYRAEVTDTSLLRAQAADEHTALGEVALAEGKYPLALREFRLGDIGYDDKPANECAPCLSYNLGRAYDAAGQADSAIAMFERYIATPYFLKADENMDPVRLPAIHERLGQMYEAKGDAERAVAHYRAFIALWKNADADLQPRVNDARQRLERLKPVERARAPVGIKR